MLRVLIADKLSDTARTGLQEAGCEVLIRPDLKGDLLTSALAELDPDVLVVRSTRVDAPQLEAARALTLVVRAGAGVNNIDLEAASARGVYVCNCPGTNAAAVAELTWAHILNADRRLADGAAALRDGRWMKKTFSAGNRGLKGRTLGVIGCGTIGQEVIARAHAFGMSVVAWSRSLTDEAAAAFGARRMESAVEVARRADVLTVHLALSPATRGLIGQAIFDALRPGAIVINTSRGEVMDERALVRAVEEKQLRVGLDVFCNEPPTDSNWRSDVTALEGVWGTHHIGASTDQAQDAVAAEVCRVVVSFLSTGTAPNCVNLAERTPATHLLIVRHQDKVGVLAGVLEGLREAELNVGKMENIIFSAPGALSGGSACARIQIAGLPAPGLLDALRKRDTIFDVKVVPLDPHPSL
jgi:D-3-phosphoglycerate dehydrogenase